MSARAIYFADLINDCEAALDEAGILAEDPGYTQLLAALVLSDAVNGVRKALLGAAGNARV